MANTIAPSSSKRTSPGLYGAIWAVLALAAAGYIGTLVYKPDLLGAFATHPVSDQESNKGVRSLSKAMARLKLLRFDVKRLESEITRLKAIDAATAQNADALHIPTAAKTLHDQKQPGTNAVPQSKARLQTKTAKTVAAAKKTAPGPMRRSARKLAARFTDRADQNGTLLGRSSRVVKVKRSAGAAKNTPVTWASLQNIDLANQPDELDLDRQSRKNSDRQSRKVAGRQNLTKKDNAKPGKLIGRAVQGARKNIVANKSVKTINVKIPRITNAQKIVIPTRSTRVQKPRRTSRAAAKIQTGSVRAANQPIRFGAPVIKRSKPRARVGIRLSSSRSKAALRLNWLALKDRYGDILEGMAPRYETLGNKANRQYRLIAGPLESAAHALSVCDHFQASNIGCKISSFAGRKL